MLFYGNDSPNQRMASSVNFMMYVCLYDVYFMLYVCLYDVLMMYVLCNHYILPSIVGRKISEIPYDIHKYIMRMFFTEYMYNLNKCCTS